MPQETPVKKVSSAKEIKKTTKERLEGKVLNFPSGFSAKVRRPVISTMLRQGKIPADLTNATIRQLNNDNPISQKEVIENIKWIELVFAEAFIDPRFNAETPAEEEIGSEDLTDQDRMFLFDFIQRGVSDLGPFRDQTGSTPAGSVSPKIPQPTT